MGDLHPDLAMLLAAHVAAADTSIVIADAIDPDYPLTYVNAAFERLTGYTSDDVVGRNCRLLQGPSTDRDAARAVGDSLRAGRSVISRLLNYRADGSAFWNEVRISPVRDAGGTVTGFIGIQLDVTSEVLAMREVTRAATLDPLTGLPNRTTFAMEAERELARAHRHKTAAAVLFLDVDNFKRVNDTFGHLVGDGHLTHVAETLRSRLRSEDVVARQSGDEFTVLLTGLEGEADSAAESVARDLRREVARPFHVDGAEHTTSITIGVAVYPTHGTTVRELISRADADMYRRRSANR